MTRVAFNNQSLVTVPGGHRADPRQKSHANRIDGRGRSVTARRRAHVAPPRLPVISVTPTEARDFWSALMARRCGSRENCAVMFAVTFQTACNWFDGFSTPTGDKVMQAQRWWPEEFAEDGEA